MTHVLHRFSLHFARELPSASRWGRAGLPFDLPEPRLARDFADTADGPP